MAPRRGFRRVFRRRNGGRRFGGRRKKMMRFSRMLTRVGRPKAELKHAIVSWSGRDVTSTTTDFMIPIFDCIQQGVEGTTPSVTVTTGNNPTAQNNRLGNKIFVEYLYFHFVLTKTQTAAEIALFDSNQAFCRVRLLKSRGQVDSTQVTSVIQSTDGVSHSLTSRNSISNSTGSLRVLRDWSFCIQADTYEVPPIVGGEQVPHTVSVGNMPSIKYFRVKVPYRRTVRFREIWGTVAGEFPQHDDVWFAMSSNLATTFCPVSSGFVSIAFRDA